MASESKGKTPGSAVDKTVLFLAARILMLTGHNAEDVVKLLKEIYGVEVPLETVRLWCATVPPEVKRSPSLLALIENLTREKLPVLAYISGAALGDGDEYGQLRVKDPFFAYAYANALAILTSDEVVEVKRDEDGFYRTRCFVFARYVRKGLWKVFAYLDGRTLSNNFLTGLLDAEGTISPHIDTEHRALYKFQIMFSNTNEELVDFVMDSLRELGFKPRKRFIPSRTHNINGKKATSKPGFMVHAEASIRKVTILSRLHLHCERKLKMLRFLILLKDLPPRLRYELFTRCWKKENSKWIPQDEAKPLEEYVQHYIAAMSSASQRCTRRARTSAASRTPQRRTRRAHTARTVQCECGRTGTLRIQKSPSTVRVYVDHEDGCCELTTLKVDGNEAQSPARVMCKCGRPGYIYTTLENYTWRGKYSYTYVRLRIYHVVGEKKEFCSILTLRGTEPTPPTP